MTRGTRTCLLMAVLVTSVAIKKVPSIPPTVVGTPPKITLAEESVVNDWNVLLCELDNAAVLKGPMLLIGAYASLSMTILTYNEIPSRQKIISLAINPSPTPKL